MFNRYAASRERMKHDLDKARLLLGQRLSVLLHDQYYFNDEKCPEDIGSLVWLCGEHQTVSMYLLADGESVGAELSDLPPPAPFELGADSACSWRRENLLSELSALSLEGKIITEVQGVVDKRLDEEARLVAFKITFETGDYLIYLNQGDDAVMLINEPAESVTGIETRLVTSLG
ncbi:hypothetical protein K5R88_07025 [Pseudomonas sp. MM213]|uniref:hypothetical protein n=1 Tax=Pseudomonas sp. MM213 TaxID=2866807 RepID=UPI001CF2C237|nr:hypothetical protein [Pseudomonas sp. MM213]UCP11382.1 hypothetical protein K5R88_07025 [Pseudomonas sp. MM213]